MANAYDDIMAEREAQIRKGRDAAHDDGRTHQEWMGCLGAVIGSLRSGLADARRSMWVKVGSVAVAAIESIDRVEK